MATFRTLTAREIECRVAQIKKTGLSLLLYKDARCDMAILDETFGTMGWQRHHSRENANCIVSIWDGEKQQWIDKEDTGTESNTEAAKGLASDSFKRACVNVGIGRELYTAPFIWVPSNLCEIKDNGGRFQCFDRFEVTEIGYNQHREINHLVIVNAKSQSVVYRYDNGSGAPGEAPEDVGQRKLREIEQRMKDTDTAAPGQIQYILEHATENQLKKLRAEFGENLERMPRARAEKAVEHYQGASA